MDLFELFSILFPYPVESSIIEFRLILYCVLFVIQLGLIYYFHETSAREEAANGLRNPLTKYYMATFVGFLLMTVNTLISSISLYASQGKVMFLGHEKAVLYSIGTIIILYGLTNISSSIIGFGPRSERIFKISFYLAILIGSVGVIYVFLHTLNLFPVLESIIEVNVILSTFMAFYFLLLIFVSVGLFFQYRDSPSPLEGLRIRFALFAFLIQLLQLFLRGGIVLNEGNSTVFTFLVFIASPVVDLFGFPLTILFLSWSLFTPMWLQIRTNVIPAEYRYLV